MQSPSLELQPSNSALLHYLHHHEYQACVSREMQNISRRGLPSGILSLSSQKGQCRTLRLQDYKEYKSTESPLPPSIKCNVLRESLSEDSQNIPCATLESRGSWVISVYLCVCRTLPLVNSKQKLMHLNYSNRKYTVKKVIGYPVPSRDVTELNYSRPGRVW